MKKYLAAGALLLATCSFTFAQGAGGAGGAGSAGGGGTGAGGSGTGGPGTGGTGGAGSGTGTGAPGTGAQGSTSGTGYMGGYTQTPWFADQNARQQLGISNDQFNQLNKSYTNYWRDFNKGSTVTGGAGTGANGTGGRTNGTGTQGTGGGNGSNTTENGVGAQGTGGNNTGGTSATQKSNATANFGQTVSKAAQDILKPEQYNRYRQLDLQSQGWNAFNDPDVQKKMNLTDQQRQQLQLYQMRWNQTMNQVYSSNDKGRDSAMKTYQDARQQYQKQMQQFLTTEQQQAWTQLTGDPYEFRPYWDQTKQPAANGNQPLPK